MSDSFKCLKCGHTLFKFKGNNSYECDNCGETLTIKVITPSRTSYILDDYLSEFESQSYDDFDDPFVYEKAFIMTMMEALIRYRIKIKQTTNLAYSGFFYPFIFTCNKL